MHEEPESVLADNVASQAGELSTLYDQISTQTEIIDVLTEQYELMKTRLLEMLEANDEMRNIVCGYVNIVKSLRSRDELTTTDRDLLKAFDSIQFGIKNRRNSLSFEKNTKVLGLEFTGSGRIVATNSEHMHGAISNQSSVMEIPSVATNGSAVQDVIVLRRRSLLPISNRSFLEEHPYINVLAMFPLFAKFPDNIMEEISLTSYEINRKEGQTVIRKGEEGAEMFFLLEGRVSVLLNEGDGNSITTTLTPVTFFGELGVLFKFQRTASVIAKTDCKLLVVMKHKMYEVVDRDPQVRAIVDNFIAHKELWMSEQKYSSTKKEGFGAEFMLDIARKDIKKQKPNQLPIFSSAPDAFIQSLAAKIQPVVIKTDELVVSIGEDSDALYFIVSGVLEVVGSLGVVHAEMTDGAFFGEVGILLNLKRTASVRAKAESHVFKLSKTDLDEVVVAYPAVKTALQAVADERYAMFKARMSFLRDSVHLADEERQQVPDQFDMEIGSQSLAKLSIFKGVEASVLSQLSMKMVRKTWKKPEMIIKSNELGDSMFFLAAGNAEVVTEFGEVIDTVSGPSAYFGEVALLESVPRTASIRCTSSCSTYELKKVDFLAVMAKYPEIAQQIKETSHARMQKYLMRNQLALKLVNKTWNNGQKIIEYGDFGNGMFFLAAGIVDVITEFGEVIDTVSGPSAYFGEVALVEEIPRIAKILCVSECNTYEVKKKDFLAAFQRHPQILEQIKKTANTRMQSFLMRNVLA
ncbi:hypothetical protein HDU98_009917 [Podochytrium sp. JEL0797]|nr:hypothetical protein HDU98_009917 [Podochytrium sp. JEL0797]